MTLTFRIRAKRFKADRRETPISFDDIQSVIVEPQHLAEIRKILDTAGYSQIIVEPSQHAIVKISSPNHNNYSANIVTNRSNALKIWAQLEEAQSEDLSIDFHIKLYPQSIHDLVQRRACLTRLDGQWIEPKPSVEDF